MKNTSLLTLSVIAGNSLWEIYVAATWAVRVKVTVNIINKGEKQQMNTVYMTNTSTLPPSLPFPEALMDAPMSITAKVLYARMLDEAMNRGRTDDAGKIFIVFPIREMAFTLSRSSMTMKRVLRELEDGGLIKRNRQGAGKHNRIYVLIPEERP
jgi:hypothetical protein